MDAVATQSNMFSYDQKPKFYKISGYLSKVANDDKLYYLGCPDCRKKVQEEPAGYRCETCNKVHMTCKPIYIMTAKITDLSEGLFVTFINDLAEPILQGKTASEMKEFKELNEEKKSPEEIKAFF